MTLLRASSPDHPAPDAHAPRLQVDYVDLPAHALLDDPRVLAVLGFGEGVALPDDPRVLRVPLQAQGAPRLEAWRVAGPVRHGRDGAVRWAQDDALLFGAVEVEEGADGIEAASTQAYASLVASLARHGFPHLLRAWNYLDAITDGEGDDERYRRFCVGRARGLDGFAAGALPAATAIGRRDGVRSLQLYWLAARAPGTPLENPRQVAAWRYPRQYGPQPPSFARAMLPPDGSDMPLLLSGTASVVGHASQHAGIAAQLEETFANFDSLVAAARVHRPALPPSFGPGTRLKVYVRDAACIDAVAAWLDARLGDAVPRVLLHAAVCRRELLVEIDGTHA